MIGKITLTKEQSKAIELQLEINGGDKAELLNDHATMVVRFCGWSDNGVYVALNGLDQSDMARALLIGYEVEPEYKVEDWVIWEHRNKKLTLQIKERIFCNIFFADDGNEYSLRYVKRHATPEEIKAEKERRAWSKIGRVVGEFREGDVGVANGGAQSKIYRPGVIAILYEGGHLKGFYPAESYVSFEDNRKESKGEDE